VKGGEEWEERKGKRKGTGKENRGEGRKGIITRIGGMITWHPLIFSIKYWNNWILSQSFSKHVQYKQCISYMRPNNGSRHESQ